MPSDAGGQQDDTEFPRTMQCGELVEVLSQDCRSVALSVVLESTDRIMAAMCNERTTARNAVKCRCKMTTVGKSDERWISRR